MHPANEVLLDALIALVAENGEPPLEMAQQMVRDATRYRKLKNSRSPFTVLYYGSKLLPDERNRTKSCELLTGEMDAMIDSWPEEEHDV